MYRLAERLHLKPHVVGNAQLPSAIDVEGTVLHAFGLIIKALCSEM